MKENTEKAILKNWESDKKARRDERTKKEEEAKVPPKPKNYVFKVKNFELSLEETDHP